MHALRRIALAGIVTGLVVLGLVAQAGAHLLALTAPTAIIEVTGPVTAFSEPGPHAVGVRTLPAETESPEMTLWYPAAPTDETARVSYAYGVRLLGPNTETALATFGGRAALGAPALDSGAHPLVILSHGFALTPGSYGWLAEHLASHGMVVVAPDHPETLDPGRLWLATIDRPALIHDVFDALDVRTSPGGELHGVIDMSTVAVVGHSYGGYTALAAGGAQLDLDGFQTSCREARGVDDPITFLCDALEPHRREIEAGWEPARPDLGVDAIVSIAGDAAMLGTSGLASLTAPVMVIGGTADTDTPYAWGPGLTYAHAGSERKVEVTLEGAGHLVFAGRCESTRRILALADLGFCADPTWDRNTAQSVVKHHVAAFLRSELMGDSEATVTVGSNAPDVQRVAYRAEGY
jgi:predicted dienelactone hydrolase